IVHEVKPLVEIADDRSVRVNQLRPRKGDKHGRIMVENIHGTFEEIRADEIVRRSPTEVFARRQFKTAAGIARCSQLPWIAAVLDTRVFGRISTADLVAAVSGAIIREDQLKISVCLIEVRL